MTSNLLSLVTQRLLMGAFALGLGFTFSNCSKSADVVQWPALREMDNWAEKAEGWSETNNTAEMQKALPDVKAAAKKLISSPVPANAHQPKEVDQTLADFRDLLKQLDQPKLADDDLKVQMAAIHPLVEKLMEQSGMPHVHEHEHEKK